MKEHDVHSIDRYWCDFFGLAESSLSLPGILVVTHAWLGNYCGAWLFVHGETGIVSAPPGWVETLAVGVKSFSTERLLEPTTVEEVFGDAVERSVGPAWHGYAHAVDFRPQHLSQVRQLAACEQGLLQGMAQSGDRRGWEDGGFDGRIDVSFGCFVRGELVSISRYFELAPNLAFPGVFTHPAHRHRGYGRATLSAAFEHAFTHYPIVLYQTLLTNSGSLALARQLGCRDYGQHVAVRLKE